MIFHGKEAQVDGILYFIEENGLLMAHNQYHVTDEASSQDISSHMMILTWFSWNIPVHDDVIK